MAQMDKMARMFYVRDIVDKYKRVNVETTLDRFIAMTNLEVNSALKKNIYNDLESLCKIGYLFKDYFHADGAPMSPDEADNYPMKNVEYFLKNDNEKISGGGLLDHCESKLISSPKKITDWTIINLADQVKDNDLSFSMKMSKNGFLGINISSEEIPLTLLIGNKGPSYTPDIQELISNYGQFTSLLLLSESGVESPIKNNNHAHAILKFEKNDSHFKLRDLGSKHGTFYCEANDFPVQVDKPTTDGIFNEIKYQASSDIEQVIILDPEPLSMKREWKQVSSEEFSQINVPALIRLGAFVFYITKITLQ